MSANVETMFSVREKPWHGLGQIVQEAPTSKEAIELAGLNWEVNSNPVYDNNGNVIKGYKANTRSTDGSVFGIVTDRYKVVQNTEAFDFTDSLVGEGMTYETAGSLKGGKTIWLLGKLPEREIVGDKVEPYVCFSNSHDGLGAVRCAVTPVRVVCNNTLNLALQTATRAWSTKHTGDIMSKLNEARHTLALANDYLDNLADVADMLANEKMASSEIMEALEEMFPVDESMSERQKNNMEKAKNDIIVCTFAPDIEKFINTKWGFINAVSDFVGHAAPARMTSNYNENRWGRIMNGHAIMDKAVEICMR